MIGGGNVELITRAVDKLCTAKTERFVRRIGGESMPSFAELFGNSEVKAIFQV